MARSDLDSDVKTKHPRPELQTIAIEVQDAVGECLGSLLVLCHPDRSDLLTKTLVSGRGHRLHLQSPLPLLALRALHTMVEMVS